MVKQFLSFATVGTVGFLVDAGTLAFVHGVFHWNLYGGRLASFFCSVTCTWTLNRSITFRHNAGHSSLRALIQQWLCFIAANSLGALVNFGVYSWLLIAFSQVHEHPTVAVACGSIAGLFVNFGMARRFVFRAV